MRRQKRFIQSIIFALLISAFALAHVSGATVAERIRFKIDVAPALSSEPLSGRLLIFMTNQTKTLEMIEPDFLNPRSVFAAGIELHNLLPGKPVEVDPDALSFPAPFSSAPVGNYQLMALLDLNHSYTYNGTVPCDIHIEDKRLLILNTHSSQPI